MPFSGPRRSYQAVRPYEPYTLGDAIGRAQSSRSGGGGVRTDLLEEDNRNRRYDEEATAELAMTPGVRRGLSIADHPSMRTFKRAGQDYSYDPATAGADEGAVSGARDATADEVRFTALSGMPGFTKRSAARLVYGRSQGDDDEEARPMRAALAEYMKSPSRELAARAIEVGASMNQFPDRFAGEEPEKKTKVNGPNGEIGVLDLNTGEVEWTGERGPAPRDSVAAAAASDAARTDRERAVESRFARTQASAAHREMGSLLRNRPRPSQFVDPLTRQPDDALLADARRGFSADSTALDARVREADDYVKALGAPEAPVGAPPSGTGALFQPPAAAAPAAAARAPDDALIAELKADHANAIQRIRASRVSQPEKDEAIRKANEAFRRDMAGAQ